MMASQYRLSASPLLRTEQKALGVYHAMQSGGTGTWGEGGKGQRGLCRGPQTGGCPPPLLHLPGSRGGLGGANKACGDRDSRWST